LATKKNGKFSKLKVSLATQELTIYAGAKVLNAIDEISKNMTVYEGVRVSQLLEAVYKQGPKDGRKEVIDGFMTIEAKLNYLPPGKPKKKRR
jgi:hypothetical protein